MWKIYFALYKSLTSVKHQTASKLCFVYKNLENSSFFTVESSVCFWLSDLSSYCTKTMLKWSCSYNWHMRMSADNFFLIFNVFLFFSGD